MADDDDDFDDFDDGDDSDEYGPVVTQSVSTKEEGLNRMRAFFDNKDKVNYLSYAVLFEKDDHYEFYPLYYNPCYGNLRKYGENSTRPKDHKPSDLKHPISVDHGKPVSVALACNLKTGLLEQGFFENVWRDIFLHEKSPWIDAFKGAEIVETDVSWAVLIPDAEVDPTLLVSAFKNAQLFSPAYGSSRVNPFRNIKDIHPVTKYIFNVIACKVTATWSPTSRALVYPENPTWSFNYDEYSNSAYWSFKDLWNGRYNNLTGGLFTEGADYNRPYLHHMFSPFLKDTIFPEQNPALRPKMVDGQDTINSAVVTIFDKVFGKPDPKEAEVLEAIKEVDNEFEVYCRS